MTASLNDIIRITDKQQYITEQVLNVYYYQIRSITGLNDPYLPILADWFTDNVVAAALPLQTSGIAHVELVLENLSNGIDILTYNTGYPLIGTATATDTLPPFVSLGFELQRETRATKNGYKRLAGIGEDDVTNGIWIGGDTRPNAYAAAVAADIVIGLVTVADPVIVKHPIDVPLIAPVVNPIGSARFKGVGSQNTRKFNRGV